MRQFIKRLLTFLIIPVLGLLMVIYAADESSDVFYLRFTSTPQSAMIIGTSKAAQGILPQVLDSSLINIYPKVSSYNYAFTIAHSPFGPAYYRSITKKVDPKSKDGYFIVSVDPLSISAPKTNSEDSSSFGENNLCVSKIDAVHMNPNIPYLVKCYDKPLLKILQYRIRNYSSQMPEYLHKNGWLEVTVDMKKEVVAQRTKERTIGTANATKGLTLSRTRISYLIKTIQFLKQHGDVYLVRLPTHLSMFQVENSYMPNFNELINKISITEQIPYIDLTSQGAQFEYVDGIHLYKKSGRKLSRILSDSIIKHKK